MWLMVEENDDPMNDCTTGSKSPLETGIQLGRALVRLDQRPPRPDFFEGRAVFPEQCYDQGYNRWGKKTKAELKDQLRWTTMTEG